MASASSSAFTTVVVFLPLTLLILALHSSLSSPSAVAYASSSVFRASEVLSRDSISFIVASVILSAAITMVLRYYTPSASDGYLSLRQTPPSTPISAAHSLLAQADIHNAITLVQQREREKDRLRKHSKGESTADSGEVEKEDDKDEDFFKYRKIPVMEGENLKIFRAEYSPRDKLAVSLSSTAVCVAALSAFLSKQPHSLSK